MKRIDWSGAPLGQKTDMVIAALVGCKAGAVKAARKRLGVPAFDGSRSPKGIDWDCVGLGTRPDTEIAKSMGVATPVVFNARRTRGIPALNPRKCSVDWDSVPLGSLTDAALADTLGVSQPTVTRHRNSKGILPFQAHFLTTEGEGAGSYGEALIDLFWHEQGIPHQFQVKLGRYIADWVIHGHTVVEYAGFIESRTFGAVYKKRLDEKILFYKSLGRDVLVIRPEDLADYRPVGTPETTRDLVSSGVNWSKQPLGTMSDSRMAKVLGVSQTVVSYWRRKRKIPCYKKPPFDWSSVPLGKQFDKAIASLLGVSSQTVRRARLQLNIPSYRESCRAS